VIGEMEYFWIYKDKDKDKEVENLHKSKRSSSV